MPGFVQPRTVAVGYDIRKTSPALARALKRGLTECGVDVLDIGLCGTEGSYFATAQWQLDGGIMVTASHNPPDYNGMKFVREGARPISADTGLKDIQAAIAAGRFPPRAARTGTRAAAGYPRALCAAPAGIRRPQSPEAAEGGGQRRQWRRRPDRGSAGAASAVPVHQAEP